MPTFDASSSATGTGATLSWTHTPVAAPDGVRVGVAMRHATVTIDSCTYGGTAMTAVGAAVEIGSAGTRVVARSFFLAAPAAGAQTVTVTLSAAPTGVCGGAVTYTSVASAPPVSAQNTATGASSTPSVTVTSGGSSDLIADNCAYQSDTTPNPSVGAGQTEEVNVDIGSLGTHIGLLMSREPGPANVVMDWSGAGTMNNNWATLGYAIFAPAAPAAAAGRGRIWMNLHRRRREE